MTATTDLTKVTVYFTAKAVAALGDAAERTGDSKTDTINRAVQIYAALLACGPRGWFSFEHRPGDTWAVWVTPAAGRRRVVPPVVWFVLGATCMLLVGSIGWAVLR